MTSKPSQWAHVVKPCSGLFVGRLTALWTSRQREMLGTLPKRSSIILKARSWVSGESPLANIGNDSFTMRKAGEDLVGVVFDLEVRRKPQAFAAVLTNIYMEFQ